jgi:hypothetical protein
MKQVIACHRITQIGEQVLGALMKETADSDVDTMAKMLVPFHRKRKPTKLSSHTNNMVLLSKEREKMALDQSMKEYQRKERDLEADSKEKIQKHTILETLYK